jgi:glutamate synthase domain-containing protein 3
MEHLHKITIDAEEGGKKMHYRELNSKIRAAIKDGANHIILRNISGQRFIGAGIKDKVTIEIYGDAGLDTGVFSEGTNIIVHGNSEYLLGNTLNGGEMVVYGDSWDITGMGARGGNIFVMGEGGSRIGIHMKEVKDKKPAIVYGGRVKQYCGEYMAGGTIIVLGIDYSKAIADKSKPVTKDDIDPKKIKNYEDGIVQSFVGGGMHAGKIFIRGDVPEHLLGIYAVKEDASEQDLAEIKPLLERYSELFNTPMEFILSRKFTKIRPISSRPFGKVYNSTPI